IAYIDDKSVAEIVRLAVGEYISRRKETIGEKELIKEFWSKATRTENGCLEWQGALNANGYGVNSRYLLGEVNAHRIAYKIKNEEIPEGMFVCHKCDNPKCIDPDHLFAGTAKDNFIDMVNKGRYRHSNKRLDGESAAQIIRLYYGGNGVRMHHLAKKFNVSLGTIVSIVNRKTHLKKPEVIKEWERIDEDKRRNEEWMDRYIKGELDEEDEGG